MFSQLFLRIANALYGNLTLTLSIENVGVYPISVLSDLCNVDYAVQIAVLTTKYEYVQHKYTKYIGVNMKSGAQKRKDNAQQQFQSSTAKSREPTEFLLLP